MSQFASTRSERAGPRWARGIATVEFVATAPFLLLLLLGGAEVGRAFIHYATLTYSVRESARYVSQHSYIGTTSVVGLSGTTVTRARNLAVYGNILGTGSPKLPNYQTSHIQVLEVGDENVQVTATYPYQPMLGPAMPDVGYGSGSFPLTFNMQVAMTIQAIPGSEP